MTIKAHHQKCTPDEPCEMCSKNESARIVKKYEKKIDDFFSINWGNRGLSRMSARESFEDQMISPNPLG